MKYYEKENVSLELYENFGIAEWREKCLVLRECEIEYALRHLGEEDNEFVKLIKMPFPKFAENYFRQFKDRLPYVENPQFGYNLFLLNDGELTLLMSYFRTKEAISKRLLEKVAPILENLVISFDSPIKINKRNPQFKKHIFQKAYISQYITKEEAKRLGLTNRVFFENGEYKDFKLQEKIDCLNGVTREMFNCLLGMEGRHRLDTSGVSKKLELVEANVKTLVDIAAIPMSKTLGEFKNAIGYLENDEKGFSLYTNQIFKKTDFYNNYFYYTKHIINISDIIVLKDLEYKDSKTYIASKYFYSSASSVRKALAISKEDAEKFEMYIPEHKKTQK